MTVHLPGYTGTTREQVVDGLRTLADEIAADERIPLGRDVPLGVPLSLTVIVHNAHEVHQLARAHDVSVDVSRTVEGAHYTVTELRFGPVAFRVMHVEPAATLRAMSGVAL